MKSPETSARLTASATKQVAAFINKFDPGVAKLIRQCRAELRQLLPTALELVYDNYNFFVIGYAATDRASDAIVSLAASSNGVALSFYRGASLPDPGKLLLGAGKQNRFIRLPTSELLASPEVLTLIRSALATARTRLPHTGAGCTVIKSVSSKQRPRRRRTPLARSAA
jgi:hypothetical protein